MKYYTAWKSEKFKLQIYIPCEIVAKMDKLCQARGIFRSQFICELLEKEVNSKRNDKILNSKV